LRGTITSATVTASNSSARDAISEARGSTEPVLAASSTSSCSSSRDSRASVNVVLSPNRRSTTFDTPVSSHTSGAITCDRNSTGRATANDTESEKRSASDLGTSSPMISSATEIAAITSTSATESADSPRPTPRSTSAIAPAPWAPPNVAAAVPTTVRPICSVARNRSGRSRSDCTASARLSPRRMYSESRVLRTDRSAISAPANIPLPTIRARMRRKSSIPRTARTGGRRAV
jgi:hypothetical protein